MRVKRYVVNTVPDALPMIRSELGKDAVILNTKEIRVGGFLGMFRKKKMEVIAAVESGTQTDHGVSPKPPSPVRQVANQTAANAYSAGSGRPSAAAKAVTAIEELPLIPQNETLESPSVPPPPAFAAQSVMSENKKEQNQQDTLMAEIKQMKEMMVQLSKKQNHIELPAHFQMLHERLSAQEVNGQWIDKLLEAVQADEFYHPEIELTELWSIASRILKEWLEPLQDSGISSSVRVIHFVGPTGVGKTTTIAKLAAEQTLKHKRKVGFITADTYRIAAVDQLRTYANILNVPLEVVFSPSELTRAFKQLEDCELIFMDTAGRNFRNELYVSEVNSLLQVKDNSETYLVLSLTGKSKDMYVVAEQFARFGVNKVLFTKMDETETLGAIMNVMLEHHYKPAYVACGQTVPDDIVPFKIDSYVQQLMGAASYD
ncbi:flagellar biosynthesis protein FlhF [Paenibacillus abyssi]|uniref:Flagellar biosynthesis protein FlhF n=1 Tax=Paenibacillus abyssi TaxID=1340531 RepID=A0A917D6E0_9BACL|nr:flagellar biosynthesis protein FlhF [Paenibacillus abyssi]GGG12274.1 flagellar biosynthesis regulator FlhF [Paenibacillus abyssi]